jgi:hypothetical protein
MIEPYFAHSKTTILGLARYYKTIARDFTLKAAMEVICWKI